MACASTPITTSLPGNIRSHSTIWRAEWILPLTLEETLWFKQPGSTHNTLMTAQGVLKLFSLSVKPSSWETILWLQIQRFLLYTQELMGSTCPLCACSKCPNPLRERCRAYQKKEKRRGGHTEVRSKHWNIIYYHPCSYERHLGAMWPTLDS